MPWQMAGVSAAGTGTGIGDAPCTGSELLSDEPNMDDAAAKARWMYPLRSALGGSGATR